MQARPPASAVVTAALLAGVLLHSLFAQLEHVRDAMQLNVVPVVLLTDALLEPLRVAPVVARDAVLFTVVLLDVAVPAFTVQQ